MTDLTYLSSIERALFKITATASIITLILGCNSLVSDELIIPLILIEIVINVLLLIKIIIATNKNGKNTWMC